MSGGSTGSGWRVRSCAFPRIEQEAAQLRKYSASEKILETKRPPPSLSQIMITRG